MFNRGPRLEQNDSAFKRRVGGRDLRERRLSPGAALAGQPVICASATRLEVDLRRLLEVLVMMEERVVTVD